eukprot:scpid84402/ scgid21656/ 
MTRDKLIAEFKISKSPLSQLLAGRTFDPPIWRHIFVQTTHANNVQAVQKPSIFRICDIAEDATVDTTLSSRSHDPPCGVDQQIQKALTLQDCATFKAAELN